LPNKKVEIKFRFTRGKLLPALKGRINKSYRFKP